MNYLIQNEKLLIQYIPGNGAWTYQLIIPHTKDIKGKWGDLKVSGTIDNFEIKSKNLGPVKNSDKKMAINAEIRSATGKGAGDSVNVTLYLENQIQEKSNDYEMIVDCFRDAEVLDLFLKLDTVQQNEIIENISSVATEDQKVEKIIKFISNLEKHK
tara:strand:- start:151 stop:621 length:471 start_codon:yes stop_codon:yes gene_type:complete